MWKRCLCAWKPVTVNRLTPCEVSQRQTLTVWRPLSKLHNSYGSFYSVLSVYVGETWTKCLVAACMWFGMKPYMQGVSGKVAQRNKKKKIQWRPRRHQDTAYLWTNILMWEGWERGMSSSVTRDKGRQQELWVGSPCITKVSRILCGHLMGLAVRGRKDKHLSRRCKTDLPIHFLSMLWYYILSFISEIN